MTKVYLSPHKPTSSFNPHNGFTGNGVDVWFSKNEARMTIVAPTWNHDNICLGYAHSSFESSDPPPTGVITPDSYISVRDVPKKTGPRWVRRKTTGDMIVTPWWAYSVNIRRPVSRDLSLSSIKGRREQGWYTFDANGNRVSNPAALLGAPGFDLFIRYENQYISRQGSVSNVALSDSSIVDACKIARSGIDTGTVTKALASANEGIYDLLTELAELPETLRWCYGLLDDAYTATKAAKDKEIRYKRMFKRKLLTAVQLADALASVWMQYRYAISPIIYSLQDLEKVFGQYSRVYKTAREKVDEDLAPHFENISLQGFTCKGYSVNEARQRVFIKRLYDPQDLLNMFMKNINMNPFLTGLELVPLSFVAEWFVNIGDVISAVTGPQVHLAQAASISWKYDYSLTLSNEQGHMVDVQLISYDRLILSPSSHIGINWDPYIDWKRSLDAIALLWGASQPKWIKLINKR